MLRRNHAKLIFYDISEYKPDFWILLILNIVFNIFYHGGIFGIPVPDEDELELRNLQFGSDGCPHASKIPYITSQKFAIARRYGGHFWQPCGAGDHMTMVM